VRTFLMLAMAPLLLAQGGGVSVQGQAFPANARTLPAPQYQPEDLGSIAGAVVNAITGEPVKKGSLQLLQVLSQGGASGGARTYSAQSDSYGRFSFDKAPPGSYRLTFHRPGFASSPYSPDGPGHSAATLTLDRAQNMTNIVFRVTPYGVIAGRVVDDDADPVPYVQVQLTRYMYTMGRKTLQSTNSAATNDLGEYRIFDVPPGKYHLNAVSQRNNVTVVSRGVTIPESREEYLTTYYPGAVDAASSAELEISAGAQLQNVIIRLLKGRTVHVRGHVALPQQEGQPGNATAMLMPPDSFSSAQGSSIDRQGNFDIASVPPGSYNLVVRVNRTGKPTYATHTPLQVGAADVDGLAITVPPPADLNGKVRAEGDVPITLKNLRFLLSPADTALGAANSTTSASVNEDGTFHMEGVSLDRYYVAVSGMAPPRYLKSVRVGGADVLAGGLDLNGGSPGEIDIVLGANAAQVTGVVNGEKSGQPLPSAYVVLIPQEKERQGLSFFYKVAMANDQGRFAMSGVSPGQYRGFAWEQMPEDVSYLDPDFIKPLESKGQAIAVKEGDKPDLQLVAIP